MGRSWCRGMTGDLGWVLPFFLFLVSPSHSSCMYHLLSCCFLFSLFISILSFQWFGGAVGLTWDGSGAWDH